MIPEDLPRVPAGLAHRQDLDEPSLKELLATLEQHQSEFHAFESSFRSREYRWPRDAIKNWSRVWEYPFVYSHLLPWIQDQASNAKPRGLDFGSGVTFFPFTLARLGADILCADNDPVCIGDLEKASSIVETGTGSVTSALVSDSPLPFTNGQFDFAYCISVLEHIPEPRRVISELARCIKRGGLLLLTIDIDLKGNLAIGPRDYYSLLSELDRNFEEVVPARRTHPLSLLTSQNSHYPFCQSSLAYRLTCAAKDLARPLFGRKELGYPPFLLTVEGMVLSRR